MIVTGTFSVSIFHEPTSLNECTDEEKANIHVLMNKCGELGTISKYIYTEYNNCKIIKLILDIDTSLQEISMYGSSNLNKFIDFYKNKYLLATSDILNIEGSPLVLQIDNSYIVLKKAVDTDEKITILKSILDFEKDKLNNFGADIIAESPTQITENIVKYNIKNED